MNAYIEFTATELSKLIKTMDDEYVEKLMKMNPVSFEYTQGQSNTQYGLIAKEIEEIDPALVSYKDNDPTSVKYHLLNAYYIKAIQYVISENRKLKEELKSFKDMIFNPT